MLGIGMLVACSNVEEADRIINVSNVSVGRNVLVEDYTGQRCINCPKATIVLEQLQQEFGENTVVAVSIHGGPLGFSGNSTTQGLATDFGTEYYNYWNFEYQPVGLVNRHNSLNYQEWTASVLEELTKPACIKINAAAHEINNSINIIINVQSITGTTKGKLQVWLIEDNIKAIQMMPDGSTNKDYIHNHVLRTPVNGTWGEDVIIKENSSVSKNYTIELDENWNPSSLSIVSFVYNDDGVLQVIKTKIE